MEAEVTPEVEETPAPEKTVLDLASEEEATPEESPVEEATEEVPEEAPEEPEEEPVERQVPVTALQKERKRRQEAEARAKEIEARIAALESQKEIPPKPTADQFETHEEYLEALAEQKAEEKVARQFQMQSEAQRQAEQKRQAEAELTKFTSLMDKAHASDPKFEESFEYVSTVSGEHPGYSRALVTSPVADKVIKHLAANPAEAERIATLSPEGQIKAIGAIEMKISSPPKPRNVPKAPEPITPVGGNANTTPIMKYDENMSAEDKAKWKEQALKSGLPLSELL